MIHYFSYGSNLHPIRLMGRVPSARIVGVVKNANHRLTFHKKSHDGSCKCNMFHTGQESDLVYGAIYEIDPAHKSELDRFEGVGNGYSDRQIMLPYEGRRYNCFTYIAQRSHIVDDHLPYIWYKKLVVLGARYLGFPEPYVQTIESIESIDDQNTERRNEMEALIEKVISYR